MASRPASALRAAEEAARRSFTSRAVTRSVATSFSTLAASSSSADCVRPHSSSLSRSRNYRNYKCRFPSSQQCYTKKNRCLSTHLGVDSDDSSGDSDEDEWNNDNDDESDQQQQPWKTLLEMPARAAWRASDPQPPPAAVKAQVNILDAGGASAKQLRQTYDGIAASHRALAERRERERRRMVNNTRYSKRAQLKDEEILPVLYGRMETLANLRNRLAPNYAITKRVLEECQSLLAYHNNTGDTSWRPKRVIDMGIGCGSASAAALEVFDKDIEWIHGIDPSKCMRECAQEFLEEIMEQQTSSDRINPPRLTLSGSISAESSSTSTSAFDMALMAYTATELPHVGSTLAAAAILWEKMAHNGIFVMIEPGTPDGFNSIRAVRNMLLDCCPPHPKTEDNSDSDVEEEQRPVLDQCHIIAPCTHNGKCPMERHQHNFFKNKKSQPTYQEIEDFEIDDDDFDEDEFDIPDQEESAYEASGGLVEETDFLNTGFCSFVQTMSTGSHLSKGEKFSYLVAQKRIMSKESADKKATAMQSAMFQNDSLADLLARVYKANQDPDENENAAKNEQRQQVQTLFEEALALEARYLDSDEDDLGLELLQGDANRSTFGRIIRAPTKKRGHVYIDYCSAPGRLMRSRVSKALDYGVAPGLFTVARKSRWGGFWPDVSTKLSSTATGVEPTAEQSKDDKGTTSKAT